MADAAPFKPEEHRFGPTHWFEDLKVGQKFYINSRTQTESMFAAFQLASGDNHPIHYDREYCRARGHRDMSASFFWMSWLAASGRPNCFRSSTYCRARCQQNSAAPMAPQAMQIGRAHV